MNNLKHLKSRIKSISVVLKATNAVKMITNIKLARLKSQIKSVEKEVSISLKFTEMMQRYMIQNGFGVSNTASNLGIIIFSDKGLCGGYNGQLHKYFLSSFKLSDLKEVLIIGNKGHKYSSTYSNLGLNVKVFSHNDIKGLVDIIAKNNGCKIYFNQYKNILEQFPTCSDTRFSLSVNSDFEPTNQVIVEDNFQEIYERILNQYLYFQVRYAAVNADISEQSSRLVIMDNSIESAKTLLSELELLLNKTRQNNITNQIIEVVTASTL